MGKCIRWIFIFCAILVLTAIFEPPLMALFESWGWHSAPERIAGDVVNWLSSIVGEAAFPWVAASILGLAIGSWMHHFAVSFDRSRPSKESEFLSLHGQISNLHDEYWDGLKNDGGEVDFSKINHSVDLKSKALFAQLRPLGIKRPSYNRSDPIEYNVGNYSFLQFLKIYSRNGQLKDAKKEAKHQISDFKGEIQKFQSQQDTRS